MSSTIKNYGRTDFELVGLGSPKEPALVPLDRETNSDVATKSSDQPPATKRPDLASVAIAGLLARTRPSYPLARAGTASHDVSTNRPVECARKRGKKNRSRPGRVERQSQSTGQLSAQAAIEQLLESCRIEGIMPVSLDVIPSRNWRIHLAIAPADAEQAESLASTFANRIDRPVNVFVCTVDGQSAREDLRTIVVDKLEPKNRCWLSGVSVEGTTVTLAFDSPNKAARLQQSVRQEIEAALATRGYQVSWVDIPQIRHFAQP